MELKRDGRASVHHPTTTLSVIAMGLDSFFFKQIYVKNWIHEPPDKHNQITISKGGVIRDDINTRRISYVLEEIGNIRKFNALHGWIIKNCADGIDKCQYIFLNLSQLKLLSKTMTKALKIVDKSSPVIDSSGVIIYLCENKLNDLFPPTSGYFFGSYEIDEYYKDCLKDGLKIVNKMIDELKQNKTGDLQMIYCASW